MFQSEHHSLQELVHQVEYLAWGCPNLIWKCLRTQLGIVRHGLLSLACCPNHLSLGPLEIRSGINGQLHRLWCLICFEPFLFSQILIGWISSCTLNICMHGSGHHTTCFISHLSSYQINPCWSCQYVLLRYGPASSRQEKAERHWRSLEALSYKKKG